MMVDDTLVMLPADKGNATVVMDREAYDSKMRAGQNLKQRMEEHKRAVRKADPSNAIALHTATTLHYTLLHGRSLKSSI